MSTKFLRPVSNTLRHSSFTVSTNSPGISEKVGTGTLTCQIACCPANEFNFMCHHYKVAVLLHSMVVPWHFGVWVSIKQNMLSTLWMNGQFHWDECLCWDRIKHKILTLFKGLFQGLGTQMSVLCKLYYCKSSTATSSPESFQSFLSAEALAILPPGWGKAYEVISPKAQSTPFTDFSNSSFLPSFFWNSIRNSRQVTTTICPITWEFQV